MDARELNSRTFASWRSETMGTRPGNSLPRPGDYCIGVNESRGASEGPEHGRRCHPGCPGQGGSAGMTVDEERRLPLGYRRVITT